MWFTTFKHIGVVLKFVLRDIRSAKIKDNWRTAWVSVISYQLDGAGLTIKV